MALATRFNASPKMKGGQVQTFNVEYEDRKDTVWMQIADVHAKRVDGFVPLIEVNRILGYSPKYNLRGFGTRQSGLKKLSKDQFDEMLTIFDQKTLG